MYLPPIAISALIAYVASDSALLLAKVASKIAAKADNIKVSPRCYNGIEALRTHAISGCLNIDGLLNMAQTPQNTSWIGPMDSWLAGICPRAPCNITDVTTGFKSLTTACQAELYGMDVPEDSLQGILSVISNHYPTTRRLLCLKQNSTKSNSRCPTATLTTLQALIGQPLSPRSMLDHWTALFNSDTPKELLCSRCTRDYFAILEKDKIIAGMKTYALNALWKFQCGSVFGSVSVPAQLYRVHDSPSSDITETSKAPASRYLSVTWVLLVACVVGAAVCSFT